jgi:hypothetical protein
MEYGCLLRLTYTESRFASGGVGRGTVSAALLLTSGRGYRSTLTRIKLPFRDKVYLTSDMMLNNLRSPLLCCYGCSMLSFPGVVDGVTGGTRTSF